MVNHVSIVPQLTVSQLVKRAAVKYTTSIKSVSAMALLALSLSFGVAQNKGQGLPHIVYNNNYPELMVKGRPFLILCGELGNSSASDNAYMTTVWPKLKKMHLNTLAAPVHWELLEPAEGKFNFTFG